MLFHPKEFLLNHGDLKLEECLMNKKESADIMKELTQIRRTHFDRATSMQECIDPALNVIKEHNRRFMPKVYRYKTAKVNLK